MIKENQKIVQLYSNMTKNKTTATKHNVLEFI